MWSLVDAKQTGVLNKPQFIVLLYLIKMGKQSVVYDNLPKYCVEFLERAEQEEREKEREAEESRMVESEFRICLPKLISLLEKFQFQFNENEYYNNEKIKKMKEKVNSKE